MFLSELSVTDTTTFDDRNASAWAKLRAMLCAARPVRPLLPQEFYPLTEWSIEEDGWLG